MSQPKGLTGYKHNEEKYLRLDDLDCKHVLQLTFLFNNNNAKWNRIVENDDVDPNSQNYISTIGLATKVHPDFGTVWDGAPNGIPYVVVDNSQASVPVSFDYADESDPGPYPIPNNAPIEGGATSNGDRHILIINRDTWKLYELWSSYPSGSGWHCGSGAILDLASNALRPDGWTSADAAGLPIFPGLVRYDEVMEQGEIRHALRFTVQHTRKAYIHPATHYASSSTNPNYLAMGARLRLKSSVDIQSFPQSVRVILTALKRYGMFVADNGSNMFISGAPDSRWSDDDLSTIGGITANDFEVLKPN